MKQKGTETTVHLLHHLIGAVMLFAVLHFFEHKQMLEWLDAAMIRVAGQDGAGADASAQARLHRPSIVMIERDAFETVFGDTSPLPRDRLVELLAQINPGRTRVLAVDIDLAPSAAERAAVTARPLDTALAALAARGTAIVLGLPPPAASAPGAAMKWIRARCADGIRFGSVALHQRLGVVSRIERGTPTLANVALDADSAHPAPDTICALARAAHGEEAFYEEVEHAGASGHGGEAESAPLGSVASNWALLRSDTHAVQLQDGRAAIENAGKLRRVVFLGGAYNDGEHMVTVGGEAWGVQVHAASFSSLALGTADVGLLVMAGLDIGLGVLFGFLFQWMWVGYEKHAGRIGHLQWTWAWVWRFYGMRLWLLACWMVPLFITYGFIVGSSYLLANHLWLNPGPIVIGMFLHTLSLRRDAREEFLAEHNAGVAHAGAHAHTGATHAGAWAQLVQHHPGALFVQLPVAALAFVFGAL